MSGPDTSTSRPGIRALSGRVALLCGLGLVAGLLANSLRVDERVPWRHDWSRDVEVRALKEGFLLMDRRGVQAALAGEDFLVLDARPLIEYDQGHIPGALSLPASQFEEAFSHMQYFFVAGQPLIVYCSGASCDDSLVLGRSLRELGYTNIYLYAGGYADWQASPAEASQP